MKQGPFTIYFNGQPMTVPIEDVRRSNLAYTVLFAMGDGGAMCTVDGVETALEPAQLFVVDADGNSFIPASDDEWYGNEYTKDLIARMATDPETMVCCYNYVNNSLIQLVPMTRDLNKSYEVFNFLQTAIDRSVSISCNQDGERVPVVVNGQAINIGVVDADDRMMSERYERNWANSFMKTDFSNDQPTQDFTNAVASISVSEQYGIQQ